MQYTVRNITKKVDHELRRKVAQSGRSLNDVLVDALVMASGLGEKKNEYHDLDALIFSWVEDAEFDKVLKAQRKIDPKLWS